MTFEEIQDSLFFFSTMKFEEHIKDGNVLYKLTYKPKDIRLSSPDLKFFENINIGAFIQLCEGEKEKKLFKLPSKGGKDIRNLKRFGKLPSASKG